MFILFLENKNFLKNQINFIFLHVMIKTLFVLITTLFLDKLLKITIKNVLMVDI